MIISNYIDFFGSTICTHYFHWISEELIAKLHYRGNPGSCYIGFHWRPPSRIIELCVVLLFLKITVLYSCSMMSDECREMSWLVIILHYWLAAKCIIWSKRKLTWLFWFTYSKYWIKKFNLNEKGYMVLSQSLHLKIRFILMKIWLSLFLNFTIPIAIFHNYFHLIKLITCGQSLQ